MLDETLTIILAGGIGSRLQPLTRDRAKPAVPFGGKYRIIDFTLSNCLHSGLRRILVLTQYKSHSLQKHLRDGWSIFNPELGEYITTVPPQMRMGESWYAGTADAIYQNLYLLERSGARQVLILSGDHIYRMDYAAMLRFHEQQAADVTIACMEVDLQEASQFGVLSVDAEQRITAFAEKPDQPTAMPDDPRRALVSMGIYVFSTELLLDRLRADHADPASSHDFGKDILPGLIQERRLYAHRFGGEQGRVTPDRYWRDVGTLDAFYEANMDLLRPQPSLNLYQKDWPIRTYQPQAAPARTIPGASGNEGLFLNSIVAGGTVIAGGSVQHSILFPHVYIGDETVVQDSLLFNEVEVGDGCELHRCIVDKGVRIPDGTRIGVEPEADRERFTISPNGIVVVARDAVL
ncbi:glucose-1-phosphate adenylyltransferase [Thiohalobacter sp. IOR34]|uniref:glucose-1-phosphate adenylyltransferase n=1 Tax=Thiohalobacter sp. IOR34 TaxID=3057176 RepID=UPI0025AFF998|nr:glucose-1-phosphate adenylyltransferase [Thiohalobacter sp. IOR34]WJW76168.1 glucose-1-phosphate adenylyltransferase [Thiohalobacter sp. IOR34]